MSDSLWPPGLQHARPPCPSPTPRVHPNSCSLSRWCHPIISFSVVPFSSCPQSFSASGLFKWVSSSPQLAKVVEFQLQHQSFQWQHIKKQRHYFVNKGPSSQGHGFSSGHVWIWELDCEESLVLKNWCFWTLVLEKTLESPLDCKEIQPVHSKGDQPWDFFGRNDAEAETPILWPPHVTSWLIGKDRNAGKD